MPPRLITTWSRIAAVFVLAALLGSVLLHAESNDVYAQQGINVTNDQPQNNFPSDVTFKLTFTSSTAPREVRLNYELAPDGTGATAIATCSGGTTVNCSYALTNGRGIVLIPGANITYHWDVAQADGSHSTTQPRLYVYDDTRFTFKAVQRENVTLYYHSGSQDDAQSILDAAVEAIDSVGALEQTSLPFPVKVFLYSTAQEMQPAIVPGGLRGVTVLGEVVYSDTAMVSADIDTLDIARHEVAHIVTGQATKGPFGIASWLNEGISVASQRAPLESHAQALAFAIRGDTVLSVRELNSPSAGDSPSTVSLFYGESGAIVKHLIDAHGADKFAELLRVFKDGSTPDDAFEKVYGFDQLGLENEWRESVGLRPRSAPTPAPAGQATAHAQPSGAAGSTKVSDSSGRDYLPLVLVAVLVVLVVAAGLGAYATLRRRL